MRICKFCNNSMLSEYETKPNNRYFEFSVCPNCKAVYECNVAKKGKEQVIESARWYNPQSKEFESEE